MKNERIVIIGSSRGLGYAIARKLIRETKDLFLISRKTETLQQLGKEKQSHQETMIRSMDLTQEDVQTELFYNLQQWQPQRIICCLGGGPFGKFEQKEWKDHLWALNCSFLFQARLLHFILKNKIPKLEQIIFMGSSIAESKPDPQAAMYAASKHALKGLISSVLEEQPKLDIRLFSPGYMDTHLLPPNAWPRQQGLAQDVSAVAERFVNWIYQETDDKFLKL